MVPERVEAAVAALRQRPIAATEKGFATLAAGGPPTAAGLGARRPPLFGPGLSTPVLVLRESALAHNIAAMSGYCRAAGVSLAPHGKTTMAPQLFARQLDAGAWGITAATIGQVRVCRAAGVGRVLLANELTDGAGAAWLAGELAAAPGFECYVYADAVSGVRLLDEAMRRGGLARPLPVLVEVGYPGGRTGCRTPAETAAVAQAVTAAGSLRLAGVAGYEGGLGRDRSAATLAAVAGYCRRLRALAGPLAAGAAPGEFIVTAGGSAFFDVVVRELAGGWDPAPPAVVLRSGVYIAFDHGLYAGLAPGGREDGEPAGPVAAPGPPPPVFEPALELWAHVLSRPEPGLALVGAGRRDVSHDAGLPIPLRARAQDGTLRPAAGMQAVRLDDQHCYLHLPPDDRLAPGDLVCLGISHPCTTFDKWRVIPVVDDSYRITDAIHTFF